MGLLTGRQRNTPGSGPYKGTSEQLATLVKDDLVRWSRIVKESVFSNSGMSLERPDFGGARSANRL